MHSFIDSHTVSSICVRMPNWLGDAVMATPVLQMLRKWNNNAKIIALANNPIATLLRENPYIDSCITFSRKSEKNSILRHLKEAKCDLGVLLTNSLSSALWFYQAKIPLRLGYAMHLRSPLLTHPVKLPENDKMQHLVITYKQLLEEIGIPFDESCPEVFISDQEQTDAQALLERQSIFPDHHTIIGINPGAAYGSAKCWPKEYFHELTKKLISFPQVRVVYFGDKNGKALVDDICKGFSPRVVNLSNQTNLRELLALIKKCHLFITNDSGPMHVAAALQTPLLAIFGSTNSSKTGPYGSGFVMRKHVPCAPCYLRSCPIDFRCMNSISPQEVFHEAQAILHAHHRPLLHSHREGLCHA